MKNKNIILLLIAATLSLGTTTAMANGRQADANNENRNQVEVRLLGQDTEYVLLQIDLQQPEDRKAVLRIQDMEGTELYSERLNGSRVSRQVKVAPAELRTLEIIYQTANGVTRRTINLETVTTQVLTLAKS